MRKPFLKAGHEFRDFDGKVLAKLARDVFSMEVLTAADFVFEPGFECKPGDVVHPAIARTCMPGIG